MDGHLLLFSASPFSHSFPIFTNSGVCYLAVSSKNSPSRSRSDQSLETSQVVITKITYLLFLYFILC